MNSKKDSSAFWLGFIIAIIIVAAISIYFYKGNKNKKLEEIKNDLEKFFKSNFKCCQTDKTKLPKIKTKKVTTKKRSKIIPKKFISKK